MSDEKKLILVFYVNVSNIDEADMPAYMNEIANALGKKDDGVDKYFIPVYNGDSRVECINPVMISRREYKKVKEKINEIDKFYKELLKENK